MAEALRVIMPEPTGAPDVPEISEEELWQWVEEVAPDASTRTRARTTLTVIAPIRSGHVEKLTARLAEIDEKECRVGKCPLPDVTGIHTMRWLILPRAVRVSGVTAAESLVLWTVFDGPLGDHMRALSTGARARLDEVYAHCEGYPSGGSPGDVATYLERHVPVGDWPACFDGTLGRTVQQVRAEDLLHRKLKQFLDQRNWTGSPQSHVYLEAKQWFETWLQSQPKGLQLALRRPVTPEVRPLRSYVQAAIAVVVGLWILLGAVVPYVVVTLLGFAVVALAIWIYLLHLEEVRAERSYVSPPRAWFAAHDAKIAARENEDSGLNRLTIVTDVHPGFIRKWTIRGVLWIVNFRATRVTDGRLQGVETIHFAQWRLVDGGRRLLFMSNYDGRADDYFRDFSDNAAPGVNAIWSNTVGFPPTSLLIGRGSRDVARFQLAARTYQVPTDVWYFGYPERSFTTKRINENTRILQGLTGYLTPPEVKEWLELVYADAA